MTDTNKDGNGNITKYKLSKGIRGFETFIKNYAEKNYKGFSNLCRYILENNIEPQTIANFVNRGARLNFSNEKDRDTFISIAKQIGQLIVNQEIKLDSFKPQELANTFNGLAKCHINLGEYLNSLNHKDKNKFIGALVGRIKDLLNETNFKKQFNSIGIANTFNGLGQCGVDLDGYFETKKDEKDAFIKALVCRIKTLLEQEQFTSQHIANTFNGLGQCGVNLCGYVNDDFIGALVGKIQNLLSTSDFNSIGIANTFNGLGQCGVDLGGYLNSLNPEDKNKFIEALVGKIQTLLEEFNSIGIANTFNGLVKCDLNLGGYVNDEFIGALVGRIQTLLKETNLQKQFTSQHIANTFNGLGQCGVNLDEYLNKSEKKTSKNAFIGALVDRIQTLLKETNPQKQFTSQHIANTFNGLGQCGINLGKYFETEKSKELKNKFIGALVGKIQNLLSTSDFNSIGIANTFNGLAQCGVNLGKYFETEKSKKLKNKFIGALVGRIKDLLKDFNSIDIANTFNGLDQCGVNLCGYVNDDFIGALVGKIQNLLSTSDFNSIGIANTFNGLAKCGVNLGGYLNNSSIKVKNAFIGALVGRIQTLLKETNPQKQFTSQHIANTFNGLVKLFLYNKDLYEKNISQFENIINDLVQKYFKQSNRDNRSDWAMLYNIKYLQVCGFKIDEKILLEITNLKPSYLNDDHTLKLDALNDDHTNTTLEENFEAFLKKFGLKIKTTEIFERENGCYELESKLTFQVTSHVSFERLIDFYIEFIQDNKTYKAYIELDGPTHFTDTEQTRKTPQTQIRDILTLKQLQEEQAKADDNTQILYVTLSAKKFDEIKKSIKTKKDLLDFLTEKNQLKQITEKTSDNSKMAVEYKSIYDSVNDVASKTIDIDYYTTPTPGQAVSELAQKAQQDDGWITVKSNYKGKSKDKKTKTKTKSRKISIK